MKPKINPKLKISLCPVKMKISLCPVKKLDNSSSNSMFRHLRRKVDRFVNGVFERGKLQCFFFFFPLDLREHLSKFYFLYYMIMMMDWIILEISISRLVFMHVRMAKSPLPTIQLTIDNCYGFI